MQTEKVLIYYQLIRRVHMAVGKPEVMITVGSKPTVGHAFDSFNVDWKAVETKSRDVMLFACSVIISLIF